MWKRRGHRKKWIFYCQEKRRIFFAQALSDAVSEMINNHHSQNSDCSSGSYTLGNCPETLMMMMPPNTTTSVDKTIIIRSEMYELKGQIAFNNNHF